MSEKLWTVARYPNGTWAIGGRKDDPDYEYAEVFQVMAENRDSAKKKAQAKRSRSQRAAEQNKGK